MSYILQIIFFSRVIYYCEFVTIKHILTNSKYSE